MGLGLALQKGGYKQLVHSAEVAVAAFYYLSVESKIIYRLSIIFLSLP